MHGEKRYNSIDSALVTPQPRTVTAMKIYPCLFSGRFVIGQIDTGKALNLSIHLTAFSSIALHSEPHAYRKVPCCSSHLQIYNTHCHTGSNVVQLSIQKKNSCTNTKYAIPDFNPSLDHL